MSWTGTQNQTERDAEEPSAVDDVITVELDGMDGGGAMDVGEPSPDFQGPSSSHLTASRPSSRPSRTPSLAPLSSQSRSAALVRIALHTAINYGQTLEAVTRAVHRTPRVAAFADPLAADGEVAEMAGQEARAIARQIQAGTV